MWERLFPYDHRISSAHEGRCGGAIEFKSNAMQCGVLSFRQDLNILVNLKNILDDTFHCLGPIKELSLQMLHKGF